MSDDPIMAALQRIEAEQSRLREQISTKLDDILDKMSAFRQDLETTQGHVPYGLQSTLTVGQRITKIEDELRRK